MTNQPTTVAEKQVGFNFDAAEHEALDRKGAPKRPEAVHPQKSSPETCVLSPGESGLKSCDLSPGKQTARDPGPVKLDRQRPGTKEVEAGTAGEPESQGRFPRIDSHLVKRPTAPADLAILVALEYGHKLSPEGTEKSLDSRTLSPRTRALAAAIHRLEIEPYRVPICHGRQRVGDNSTVGVYWLCPMGEPTGCAGCSDNQMFHCSKATAAPALDTR